jgi:hypothetical protein
MPELTMTIIEFDGNCLCCKDAPSQAGQVALALPDNLFGNVTYPNTRHSGLYYSVSLNSLISFSAISISVAIIAWWFL